MRKLLASLLLLLSLSAPAFAENAIGPSNVVLCNKIATQAVGQSSLTQIIAAVTAQTIILCGWEITNTGAIGTFSFTSGTGVNCATNPVVVIPPLNITNTAPSVDRQQYATIQLPLGAALCITPSVATIASVIWFTQF